MSERAIAVGDLVYIARATECCGNSSGVGAIHAVTGTTPPWKTTRCPYCNHRRPVRMNEFLLDDKWGVLGSRLRRIPPYSELEGERTQEQLKEPQCT